MLGDAALQNLYGAVFHQDTAPIPTKTRGFIQSATKVGTGSWQIVFSQDLPIGEYIAGWANLTGAFGVTIEMTDGDNRNKFIETNLNIAGVPTPVDLNGWAVWWARAFSN